MIIDDTTGMPVLPEDMYWELKEQEGDSLYLHLMSIQRTTTIWGKPKERHVSVAKEFVVTYWNDGTLLSADAIRSNILEDAGTLLTKLNLKNGEKSRNHQAFVGKYPPKNINEVGNG